MSLHTGYVPHKSTQVDYDNTTEDKEETEEDDEPSRRGEDDNDDAPSKKGEVAKTAPMQQD